MGVDRKVRRGLLVVALALIGVPGVWAKVYTVGAHGAYSSLGAALAAAVSDPGVADVRVEVGWYGEFDLDTTVGVGQELLIRGGWDRRFSRRTDDPAATVLDAQGRGRILQVLVDSGKLTVRGLTFRGALTGFDFFDGALMVQSYSGETLVQRCAFVDNRHVESGPFSVNGAALVFFTMVDGNYHALDNVFRDNRVEASGTAASAAAIYAISLVGTVEVSRNLFQGNVVESDVETLNYATYLQTQVGSVVFNDNVVVDNGSIGPAGTTFWSFQGAISLAANGNGTIEARRNLFLGNRSSGEGSQLVVNAIGEGSTAILSDSLIAASPDGGGLDVWAGGEVNVVNCTIADNVQGNVRVDFFPGNPSPAKVSLANSIVFDSQGSGGYSIQSSGPVQQSHNLIGIDPSFVDPAGGDYRLRATSRVIDRGNPGPSGGLGPLDLDGVSRVVGPQVDVGAYEFH
jgi:hypothetical protein